VTLYIMGNASPPLQATDQSFSNGPRLTGYSFTPTAARPGDTLRVTLQWQATAPMPLDYTVYTQLRDAAGQVAAQPASGTRPTSDWQPGETILDRKAILLPPDLPPGTYTLHVGLYELATLKRLTLAADGADHVYLGTVQVAP
jgi:mannosyltransferase